MCTAISSLHCLCIFTKSTSCTTKKLDLKFCNLLQWHLVCFRHVTPHAYIMYIMYDTPRSFKLSVVYISSLAKCCCRSVKLQHRINQSCI